MEGDATTDEDATFDWDATVPWHSPKLRAILASTLVLPLGVSLLSPVLPAIRDTFTLSDARTSLVITLYFVPGVVFSPVAGMLADRYGRRRVMVPSLFAYGVLGASIALVDRFSVILALRFVQGAAATSVFILTVAFISDACHGLRRNAVLGVNSAVLFVGAAVYPFLGGVLASVGWNLPFLTYLVAVPAAVYAAIRLDDPPVIESRTGPDYVRRAVGALPAVEALSLYGATFVLETVAFGAILTALPFVLATDFAAPPYVIGGVITTMMSVAAVTALKNGTVARYRSNHRLLVISFWFYAVGLLFAWAGSSILAVFVGAAAVGAGFGLAHPSVDAAVSRLVPTDYRAGALSIRNGTTFLGRSVGPVAYTIIAMSTGYRALLLVSGLSALVIGAVGLHVTEAEPGTTGKPRVR